MGEQNKFLRSVKTQGTHEFRATSASPSLAADRSSLPAWSTIHLVTVLECSASSRAASRLLFTHWH
jgi:hypothetical protein